jgi:hypothetical protein
MATEVLGCENDVAAVFADQLSIGLRVIGNAATTDQRRVAVGVTDVGGFSPFDCGAARCTRGPKGESLIG